MRYVPLTGVTLVEKKLAIGVDVGGTNLRVGLVRAGGEIAVLKKESTEALHPEKLLNQLEKMIRGLLAEADQEVCSIGIGWPGPVDHERKLIRQTPNIKGFDDFPIGKELEARLSLPIHLDNDAKCAGLAEFRFGAAKGLTDFVLLTFGTGIGGVIFSNGKLHYGKSGGGGEIGHMTLYPEGVQCPCGNRGCFERYCSAKAIEVRSESTQAKQKTAREIVEASQKNEKWATDLMHEFTRDLSIGVASLVNIFDPQAIVFAGGLFTTGGGRILDEVRANIQHRCFESLQRNLQLRSSTMHGQAGLVGAAWLGVGT